MDKIIQVTGLHKSYGSVRAVRGVDFYVEKGGLFALLGPNGAGKSTIIDIICTFLKPDSGQVLVDGHELGRDDNAIRGIIGAVFQDGLLDPLLTVEENLSVRGGLYGLRGKKLKDAVVSAAEATGVKDLLKRPYGKMSGGQRRRCDITRALVNTPRILFLDEPTTGLDPQTRKNVWETIMRLQKDNGMTLFLTTHYMEEAAGADYVIIIDEGSIAARGTPADLQEKYTRDKLMLHCRDTGAASAALDARQTTYARAGNRLTIGVPSSLDALPLINLCKEYITGFEVMNGSMDDAFIAITGKEIRP